MRKRVDVQKLLEWAFVEELPKGRRLGTSPWEGIEKIGRQGTRVDENRHSGSYDPVVPGAPHEDAIKIAEAVRALKDHVRVYAEDCAALLGRYAQLDAAAAIARVSGQRTFNLQGLVVRCALIGRAILWDVGKPRPLPVCHAANGAIAVWATDAEGEYVARSHRGAKPEYPWESYCKLVWQQPTIEQLLLARVEYALWHYGLELVAEAVQGKLAEFHVTGPAASPRPWSMPAPKATRILDAID